MLDPHERTFYKEYQHRRVIAYFSNILFNRDTGWIYEFCVLADEFLWIFWSVLSRDKDIHFNTSTKLILFRPSQGGRKIIFRCMRLFYNESIWNCLLSHYDSHISAFLLKMCIFNHATYQKLCLNHHLPRPQRYWACPDSDREWAFEYISVLAVKFSHSGDPGMTT